MCRRISYGRGLFDEESDAATSNYVGFGGGRDRMGGRVERLAGLSSVD